MKTSQHLERAANRRPIKLKFATGNIITVSKFKGASSKGFKEFKGKFKAASSMGVQRGPVWKK